MTLSEFVNVMSFGILMGTTNNYCPLTYMADKYNNDYFLLPRIVCVDGFDISIQVNKVNMCRSENGVRMFGTDWKSVEWGFPSQNIDGEKYNAEDEYDTMNTVGGYVDINIMEELINEHGGIDLQATLQKHMEKYNRT